MKRRAPLRRSRLKPGKPMKGTEMPQRKTPLKSTGLSGGARPVTSPGRAPSTLPKVSKKRAAIDRVYYAAKKAYLAEHEVCERCGSERATDLHHRANRSASAAALCDPANFVALGRVCHDWCGQNRGAAIAEGFRQAGWDYRQRGAA